MENLQMRRVHGILHGLEPVGIELGLDKDLTAAIVSEPNIKVCDQRRRLWTEIGPIEADEFLHWVGFLFHREVEVASAWFRRRFQALAFGVVQPTMVGASDATCFDTAVGQRRAAMGTTVFEQTDIAAFIAE